MFIKIFWPIACSQKSGVNGFIDLSSCTIMPGPINKDITDFFNLHRWGVLRHPPYSPDLSPPDFDGIVRIKRPRKGTRYATEAELISAYTDTIYEINGKNEATGISHLPVRWEMVIQSKGEYIV